MAHFGTFPIPHQISETKYIIVADSENNLNEIHLRDRTHPKDPTINLCPLDNGKHCSSPTSSTTLGILEQLPLELINMILMRLDIRSLTDFRRVNKRAMQAIDAIPEYKKIVTHAPFSLRASLSIETAKNYTCQDLYKALCTAKCDKCDGMGQYLYLVTCRRVCYFCFTQKEDYNALLRTDAMRKFGLKKKRQVEELPALKCVPGYYSPEYFDSRQSHRIVLVDYNSGK